MFSMIIPIWLSFLISIAIILALSKKELTIGLFIAGLFFAWLTEVSLLQGFVLTFLSVRNLFLALSVMLIPILGGLMQKTNLMMQLIEKMKTSKKVSLIASPAIFGLLPIPGGALMSAPIVDEIDPELDSARKISINVWFRHVLILIYPISSTLIIVSDSANLPLYTAVSALLIPCLIMIVIGIFFLIHPIEDASTGESRNLKIVFRNILPIIIAPIFDVLGRYFFHVDVPEVFMLTGLILAVFLSMILANINIKDINPIDRATFTSVVKKSSFWKYPLLIYAMKFYIYVFSESGMDSFIGALEMNFFIFIFLGFFLGFATGRTEIPGPIIIGVYLSQFGLQQMPLFEFSLLYFAIFLGYVLTPIHPCVAYSLKYFKRSFSDILLDLAKPIIACLIIILLVSLFV